jgi:hypothetical protein
MRNFFPNDSESLMKAVGQKICNQSDASKLMKTVMEAQEALPQKSRNKKSMGLFTSKEESKILSKLYTLT